VEMNAGTQRTNGTRETRMGETYRKATDRLLNELEALGWAVKRGLKTPHATHKHGAARVWFRAQGTHWTYTGDAWPYHGGHKLGDALSLHWDRRERSAERLIMTLNHYLEDVDGEV